MTPAYFKTLGVEVLQGRAFTPRDGAPGDENAIGNQRFAALYFTEGQPIGRRFKLSASRTASVWSTIVGVSRNVPRSCGSETQDPIVYLPYRGEAPTSAFVLMRAAGDLETTAALLCRRLQEMDPDLAPSDVRTSEEVLLPTRSLTVRAQLEKSLTRALRHDRML